MAKLQDVIDLIAVFGGVRGLPKSSLIKASLLISRQVFLDQLLVRFQRMASATPEMKAEGADSAEDGHNTNIKAQIAIARCCTFAGGGPPTSA